MPKSLFGRALLAGALAFVTATLCQAQPILLADGTLVASRDGGYVDVSGLTYTLENGVPANLLGGLGSALAYASGNTFLAIPDRGPNANSYDASIDDTVSYINRFQTIHMNLQPNRTGNGLPFEINPILQHTTLLWSASPLVYGSGEGLGVGSGAPPINDAGHYYFTGRSDNFDPSQGSGDASDARFDSEGIRVSNDGTKVYVSDEYGPYVYEFDRASGRRLRSFAMPSDFYVTDPSSQGDTEKAESIGRTANKGMEGLAITPDGSTLVGIMQAALLQDAALGGKAKKLLRIVTIDLASGQVTHEYGYLLTDGSGVSELLAINNHEFLVDERDGSGRGGDPTTDAAVKELFQIDLSGATDITGMNGTDAAKVTVGKTLFLDLVNLLSSNGIAKNRIPSKIEGIAFGPDVTKNGKTLHTLWIANDNDFLSTVDLLNYVGTQDNPNEFYVVGFAAADLNGSVFVPQQFTGEY